MPTHQYVQNYFSHLSPLAEKIIRDINETKSAYGHAWLQLTPTEQDNILDESLISPEIAIKYYSNSNESRNRQHSREVTKKDNNKQTKQIAVYSFDKQNLRTFIHQNVGLKILDENIGDRDEHSSPFCFRTKSQINFSVLVINTNLVKNVRPIAKEPEVADNSPPALRPIADKVIAAVAAATNGAAANNDSELSHLLTEFETQNSPIASSSDDDDDVKELCEENSKLLPKGFDFLSNW